MSNVKPSALSLISELTQIRQALTQLQQQEQTNRQAVGLLYSELNQYKSDFIYQQEKPLINDMLNFFDSLQWFQESMISSLDALLLANQELEATENPSKAQSLPGQSVQLLQDMRVNLSHLTDELLDILQRKDIKPVAESVIFDPKFHRVVQRLTISEYAAQTAESLGLQEQLDELLSGDEEHPHLTFLQEYLDVSPEDGSLQDGMIISVLRKGFLRLEHLLRPEEVVVLVLPSENEHENETSA